MMNEANTDERSAADWDRLRPVLDEAMIELGENDRAAILLRYFQNRRLAEVGRRLGLSEDAARMRVERALDKLQVLLGRRGITSTSAALSVALANPALAAAPVGLAASVAGVAIAGGAVVASSAGGVAAAATIFMNAKMTLVTVVAVLASGVSLYEFTALRRERAAALGAEVRWRGQLQVAQQRLASADNRNAALQREVEAARAAKSVPRPPR